LRFYYVTSYGCGASVGCGLGVGVGRGVCVGGDVGVAVGVPAAVAVGVAETVAVDVAVAVGVAVGEAVSVGVGVGVAPTTVIQAENSEVLLLGSVAVAVTTCPDCTVTGRLTLIIALQLASVGMSLDPMKVSPWPKPEEWHWTLSKNSIRNVVFGALSKLP